MNISSYIIVKLKELEWSTLILVLILSASGLLAIYSIEAQHDSSAGYFLRQACGTACKSGCSAKVQGTVRTDNRGVGWDIGFGYAET